MLKKAIAALTLIALLLSIYVPGYCAEDDGKPEGEDEDEEIRVVLDGKPVKLEYPIIIEDGTSLMPLRTIFDIFRTEVVWNEEDMSITCYYGLAVIKFKIGDKTAYVDEKPVKLEIAPKLINGKAYVPLRFLSEELFFYVGWDAEEREISIMSLKYLYNYKPKKYIGIIKAYIYHTEDCPLIKELPPEYKKVFNSKEDAERENYEPCKFCSP